MKLTKRGKRVRALALVLLIAGGAWGIHELNKHTRITYCKEIPEGRACYTTWK